MEWIATIKSTGEKIRLAADNAAEAHQMAWRFYGGRVSWTDLTVEPYTGSDEGDQDEAHS